MPQPNFRSPQPIYDPRWFIWTIVFLVVTGISLVSYILFSDNPSSDITFVPAIHASTTHKK